MGSCVIIGTMGNVSYPEEEQLREELRPRLEEKKFSNFTQSLIRQGFANTPRQAQIVTLILFIFTLAGSTYFYYTSQQHDQPVPRDPYVRPLPGR